MFSLSSFSLYTSMASFSSSHFPVSTISVQQPLRFDAHSSFKRNLREIGSASSTSLVLRPQLLKLNSKGLGSCYFQKSSMLFRSLCSCHVSVSLVCRMRLFFSGTFSSLNSSGFPEETNDENGLLVGKPVNCDMGFNRVDCLVRILHESVKSFSTDMQNHEFARSVLELAKAWVGVDVHAWHKHIAYQPFPENRHAL